jgi:GWxTD domain-containing protein
MKRSVIHISVVIMLLGWGCGAVIKNTTPSVTKNVASIYNPSSSPLHPEFIVYHERPDLSRLYLRIFTQELLFNQANREGKYMGRLEVLYELREVINGNESQFIADSATIVYNLNRDEIKDVFFSSIPVRAFQDKIYSLKVTATDQLRNKNSISFLEVDKSSVNTAQNYKVISFRSGYPSFNKVFSATDVFKITYARSEIDTIYVKYYRNTFPLPRPPVTNLPSPRPEFIPDSVFAYPYSDTMLYRLPFEGMYHIQADPNQMGGLTLFNFGNSFPRVTTIDEMIGPLVYLCSTVEYEDLMTQTNKKLTLDNFWLQAAGNVETSRELIRIYYNRVFYANYFFTSYKEGWKTDRGMMFIIYGAPNTLTKSAETEVWTYYRKKGKEPLRFTFSKVSNPYSDNDYQMERDFVNSMWLQAVQDWRKGKVFYTDKI